LPFLLSLYLSDGIPTCRGLAKRPELSLIWLLPPLKLLYLRRYDLLLKTPMPPPRGKPGGGIRPPIIPIGGIPLIPRIGGPPLPPLPPLIGGNGGLPKPIRKCGCGNIIGCGGNGIMTPPGPGTIGGIGPPRRIISRSRPLPLCLRSRSRLLSLLLLLPPSLRLL